MVGVTIAQTESSSIVGRGWGLKNCQSDSKALVSNLRLAAPFGCENAACKIKYRMTANALNGQLSVVSLLVKNGTGEEEDRLGFGGGS